VVQDVAKISRKKINKKPETGKTLADEKKTYFAISRGKKNNPKFLEFLKFREKQAHTNILVAISRKKTPASIFKQQAQQLSVFLSTMIWKKTC